MNGWVGGWVKGGWGGVYEWLGGRVGEGWMVGCI